MKASENFSQFAKCRGITANRPGDLKQLAPETVRHIIHEYIKERFSETCEIDAGYEHRFRSLSEKIGFDAAINIVKEEVLENKFACRRLARAGVQLRSVWDLVNSPQDYSALVPILGTLLSELSSPRVLEGIVRSLTLPTLPEKTYSVILDKYSKLFPTNDAQESLKFALANAIAMVRCPIDEGRILHLIKDTKHGPSRGRLIDGLSRAVMSDLVVMVLMKAVSDNYPEVRLRALLMLGKRNVLRAKPSIEPLLADMNPDVRRTAARILTKFNEKTQEER